MDIFTLAETPFIRQLSAGNNENLQIHYRDFIMQVVEMCSEKQTQGIAVNALLIVEIEISHIQTESEREEVSKSLTCFISKALRFIRETMSRLKDVTFEVASEDDVLQGVGLNWDHKKVALVEIGYAFHVAKCFGDNMTVRDIVLKMAKAFNVDIEENYIYKKYNEIKVRTLDSRTYFIDLLKKKLNEFMCEQDANK